MSAGPTPADSHAQPAPARRWLFWVAAVLIAAAAGSSIGIVIALRHRTAAEPIAASGPTPPPETFAAGTRRAPAFRLTDERGAPISLAQFRGRPAIVTFIDPLCRNYCPLEAQQLGAVERSLPAGSRPSVVAVSVNVYGNARANLTDDDVKWRVGPQWHWAVGESAPLARVWKNYGIGVQVVTKTVAGVTVHDIVHTEAAYLIDGRGYERALFLWPFTASDVKAELAKIS